MTGKREDRMAARIGAKLRRWGRSERGSVTLEASMVFPWIMMITFLLILFTILAMKQVWIYYAASAAAERGAFAWGHSAADVRTGAYPEGEYDGLYWRLSDDAVLAGLFGSEQRDGEIRVLFPSTSAETGGALAELKLARMARTFPSGSQGTAAYRNRIWKREISMESAGVSVRAVVSEPAEWVRTFHLIRYYQTKMNNARQGAAAYREQAASVLKKKR